MGRRVILRGVDRCLINKRDVELVWNGNDTMTLIPVTVG